MRTLAVVVVLLGCAARVVHLNADPSMPTWIGYITDEGRWNETARNLALFGAVDGSPNARLQLLLSPAYQALNYVVFKWLGVDFWSARLFSAICGIGSMVAVFFALRRHVTPFALALGMVILAFEGNLLFESRMALPEIPSVFFSLLAFLVVVCGRPTHWNAIAAALLTALAVGMKGTTAMVVPVLPVIILLMARGSGVRAPWARALTFVAVCVAVSLAGLAIALALGAFRLDQIVVESGRVLRFFGPITSYVMVARFFESHEFEIRNLLLLGIWLCTWLWLHRDRQRSPFTSDLYLATGAWTGWWLLAWSGNEYLPGRYIVHWIVPATIHIMAGLSLPARDVPQRIAAAFQTCRGWRRAGSLLWLVFPSAVFIVAAVADAARLGGASVSRLSEKCALLAMVTAVLAALAARFVCRAQVVTAFLALPLLMTMCWLAGRELGFWLQFWPNGSGAALLPWLAACVVCGVACWVVTVRSASQGPAGYLTAGYLQMAVIVTMAAVFLAQTTPGLLFPTYSMRDASLDLKRRFPSSSRMGTVDAESLFLSTEFRFKAIGHNDRDFDWIVIFDQSGSTPGFLASVKNLTRIDSYSIAVNPLYENEPFWLGAVTVGIYRPQ
ncbi:MAG: phospholipid carrier-dependent glycosyltransferase [Betaproteobacteria bacterium]